MVKKILLSIAGCLVLLVIGFNIWGALTLGKHTPAEAAKRNANANEVVMVFGGTGSVGDALLKAAMIDTEVKQIYAVTRRLSSRLEQGQASGRVEVIMLEDFTDYSEMSDILAQVNTVMWGLGTTSIGMDPELYRKIHVDFPIAFVTEWLSARTEAPMSFHYVTGMGTGEEEDAQWAKDKGSAERRVAEMAKGTGLRTFGHRYAWIRPTEENANFATYLLERLLQPGYLVITGVDLGRAMFEISARSDELPNGALIDNKDAIEYAAAYRSYQGI